jgi:Na+-transporting NADH:ubiquinone oxidoreductase subunit NqrB
MAADGKLDVNARGNGSAALPVPARVGEMLVALALLAAGGFFIWQSADLPFGDLHRPGPGFFPSALGSVLGVLATAVLIRSWRGVAEVEAIHLGHRNVLVVFAASIAAALGFERIGAYATLGTVAGVLLLVLSRLTLWRAVLGASLGMVAVWAIFKVLLGVQLPAGPF